MTELYIYILDKAYKVDLSEGINITLQKKFKDFKEITNTQIPKTLPITLPNTDNNKIIFSGYQNINSFRVGVNYLAEIKAELYLNGVSIIKGNLQILGLSKDKSIINVSIFDKTVDVFSILKNEVVSQVGFEDLDFNSTNDNVVDSWSGSLNSGKTIFPIVDNGQGFGYVNPEINTITQIIDITTTSYSVDVLGLSPAFQLSEIVGRVLDDIVDRTEVTSWNFPLLEDDIFIFNNLKPTEAQTFLVDIYAKGFRDESVFNVYTGYYKWMGLSYYEGSPNLIDNSGNIVALNDGVYRFIINLDAHPAIAPNAYMVFNVDGVDITTFEFGIGSNQSTQVFDYTLVAGEKVVFGLMPPPNEDQEFFESARLDVHVIAKGTAGLPISTGVIVANNYFKKLKKVDLFKELVKMYNLVIYVDEDDVLQLQNYSDFLNSGSILDISSNVLEKNYSILSPYEVLNKDFSFNYKDGTDYGNRLYTQLTQTKYGSGEFQSNIPFLTKKLKADVMFQPYLPVQLQNDKRGGVDIPNLTGIKNIGSPQDIEVTSYGSWYMMYWNGTRTAGAIYRISTDSGTVKNVIDAPIFSNYKHTAGTDIDTANNDLNFFFTHPPTESNFSFVTGFDPINSDTLWNRFYKPFIAELYSTDSKILKVEAVFLPYEFNEIEDNSKIVIDGVLFRLLDLSYSIMNYTAKLTLLKLN